MSAIVKNLKIGYKLQQLKSDFPTIKKVETTFGIITVGEAASQFLIDQRKSWDYMRSFRQAFVGSCLICPMNMFYMSKIAPQVAVRLAGMNNIFNTNAQSILGGWSQFLILGPVQSSLIAYMSGFLKNGSSIQGKQAWQDKAIGVYFLNMAFVPHTTILSNAIIPAMRPQAATMMLFAYSMALSKVLNSHH